MRIASLRFSPRAFDTEHRSDGRDSVWSRQLRKHLGILWQNVAVSELWELARGLGPKR
jgi:hypothetical protein